MEYYFTQERYMGGWYGGGIDKKQDLHKASIQTNIVFNQNKLLIVFW